MNKKLLFITEFCHTNKFKQISQNYFRSFHVDTYCPGKNIGYEAKLRRIRGYSSLLRLVIYGIKNRHKYHGIVFWSEGFSAILYACFVRLFRLRSPRITVINLVIHPSRTIRFLVINRIAKFSLAKIHCIIVHVSGLIKDYQERFDYKGCITFVPESREYDSNIKAEAGDYIFSGGGSLRDWPTLVEATKKLQNERFVICDGSNTNILSRLTHGNNLTVKYNVSPGEFAELLVKSKFVVAPFYSYRHLGGNMIFLECLFFGKPVIASRNMSAVDYIRDGYNGFLVSPGNSDELANKITMLSRDDRLLSTLGNNARLYYNKFSTESFWTNLSHVISEQID